MAPSVRGLESERHGQSPKMGDGHESKRQCGRPKYGMLIRVSAFVWTCSGVVAFTPLSIQGLAKQVWHAGASNMVIRPNVFAKKDIRKFRTKKSEISPYSQGGWVARF
jgi:hypothetical protein